MITSEAVVERLRLQRVPVRWRGGPPNALRSLTADSRAVGAGDLFCALVGSTVDGHAYLGEARRAGAAAALVQRAVEEIDLPQLIVPDTRQALAHLAMLWSGDPAAHLRLVGITGTNGKTTTAWLARHLLSGIEPAAAVGTLGIVGSEGRILPGALTTPDALGLASTLRTLSDEGVRLVAMEVSSHALDQRRVDGLRFDYAVFTSFSREHLDYHHEMSSYLQAKLRLADLLWPDGVLVVNADEPAWDELRARNGAVLSTGFGAEADVRAEGVEEGPSGTCFRLAGRFGEADVELRLLGRFNVENALSAAAVALHIGMTVEQTADRLSSAPQVPGRFEILSTEPSLVVRDYAHTPLALTVALAALRPLARGRLIVVFGCGGDRDRGKRPKMGEVAESGADRVIVTSDNPRSEDPCLIAEETVARMSPSSYEVVIDRREAIARALEQARPGDVVLLAGKGHETYQIIGNRALPFDEPGIVAEILGAGGGGA
ncbi:MAG: UDP-N-acetylmuramoyl-L-alanyl-D-glutamate--2,6-diaminopimelate ligase [Gemmatimonadota bacterium]